MSEFYSAKREGFRKVIWSELQKMGDATASELAAALNRRVEVIRPRLTELLELNQIQGTGEQRNGGRRGPRERVFAVVDKITEDTEAACDWP